MFEYLNEAILDDETFNNPSSEYSTAVSSDEASPAPTCTTDEDNPEAPSRNILEQIMELVARELVS